MKNRKKMSIWPILALAIVLFFHSTAVAATFQLSGCVTDQSGSPIAATLVEVIDPATGATVASATTDADGNYALSVDEGTYDIRVTPPAESGFAEFVSPGQVINSDTNLDFVLVPADLVTVSGRVVDRDGDPVPNVARVELGGVGGGSAYTDASGNFSLQVSPGERYLLVQDGGYDDSLNIPRDYWIGSDAPISVVQDTILDDIVLPAQQVDVHVQDPAGNPVANARVDTSQPTNYELTMAGFPAYGASLGAGATTDASGNATLWLFPTDPIRTTDNYRYTFNAHPPDGTPFAPTNLSGVVVTGDTSVTIELPATVTVSGRVVDRDGDPVPNVARVELGGVGGGSAYTDASGNFSLQVSPGERYLLVQDGGYDDSLNIPRDYWIGSDAPISVVQDTILDDIVLPAQQVDVHVQDPAGNPVANARVDTSQPTNYELTMAGFPAYGASSWGGATTDASGNATLWLFPTDPIRTDYRYTFYVYPPDGTPLAPTNLSGVVVMGDTSVTIELPATVTVSGRVVDRDGDPVPNVARVELGGVGGGSAYTDASGNFSLQVSPGERYLSVHDGGYDDSLNIPRDYWIGSDAPISVVQDTILDDIVLPAQQVDVHVQDPAGNPVANARVDTTQPTNYELTMAGFPADGTSRWYGATTDASGNATLWLFPTDPIRTDYRYTFYAYPPDGTPFAPFSLSGITVTGDKSIIFVLQFVHAPPFTTATVTPSPDTQGVYPDPVTVTLSAVATPGFAVTETHYVVDGGSDQTYTAPFIVSGEGTHTIDYWSIDDAGVFEVPKTLIIEIGSNQPPAVSAGGPYSVGEGESLTVTASGTDPNDDPLTYAWDLDNDGSYETPGQSVTFSAADLDGPSSSTIAVQVTDDGGLSAIDQATVDVLNVAPSVGPITTTTDPVQVNTEISTSADFTDPGVLDTHTAVWDWGDDTTSVGVVNEIDGSGSVTGSHTYTEPGVYTVKLTVTDDDGDSGQSVFQFIIVYDPDGGFVSGCGWFNSPAGAYTDNDQLAGRATFGFVSKYDRRAGVPEGETEFHFVAASFFKFHSDTYEWLVVAPEHRARYQGTGTVWVEGEEQGSYNFRLTVIDGDLDGTSEDKFRIRIWGSSGVIYDNEITAGEYDDPTTVIEEGSIIVHTTKWDPE